MGTVRSNVGNGGTNGSQRLIYGYPTVGESTLFSLGSDQQRHFILTHASAPEPLVCTYIYRYGGEATNDSRNGLLLRADVHRLFDKLLVSLSYNNADLIFHISERLRGTDYEFIGEIRIGKNELPKLRPHINVVDYPCSLPRI